MAPARSLKSDRLLDQLGVWKRLQRGEKLVVVGPTYELFTAEDSTAALAFTCEGESLYVGYAVVREGRWEAAELEPYSLRALGYWQRWLKRHGVARHEPTPRHS
jgi:hypothetical protein